MIKDEVTTGEYDTKLFQFRNSLNETRLSDQLNELEWYASALKAHKTKQTTSV